MKNISKTTQKTELTIEKRKSLSTENFLFRIDMLIPFFFAY